VIRAHIKSRTGGTHDRSAEIKKFWISRFCPANEIDQHGGIFRRAQKARDQDLASASEATFFHAREQIQHEFRVKIAQMLAGRRCR
jgi:hypothetical protein